MKRQYHQTARAEATERTRRALFDEAQRIFFSGEWGTRSLDEIAAAAGTTKQTLLRHFGSKQGLFDAASAFWRDRAETQRFEAVPGDVPGAVDNLLDHYYEVGPIVLQLLSVEGAGTSKEVDEQAASGRNLHHEWIDLIFGPQLKAFSPAARERRRAALIALCDVYTWRILALDLGLPRRKVRQTLIESIDRILSED